MASVGEWGRAFVAIVSMRLVVATVALAMLSMPHTAAALPLFHRQTGQDCVACHAGGQFPELTPYGRLFKLTGYTLGRQTVPIAAMAVVTASSVANTSKSDDPSSDFSRNDQVILASASVFTGGRITDNVGSFVQVTYDPYATRDATGAYHGRATADNIDLRYADRWIEGARDLIWGVSLNDNPSVSDPWNTAPAWMQYVPVPSPSSSQFVDGKAPYPAEAAGSNVAGLTSYVFVDRHWYAEAGVYATAKGALSFMSEGVATADKTFLRGLNPYWRVAWNSEWGANSLMFGAGAMASRVYDDPRHPSGAATTHAYRVLNLDAQYQYLADVHSVTAQIVVGRTTHRVPGFLADQPVAFVSATGAPLPTTRREDTQHVWRGKLGYVYQARYGGSLSLFGLVGDTDTALQTSGIDPATGSITSNPAASAPSLRVSGNSSGNPATRGATLEAFWLPVQWLRVGAQYTVYDLYNGARTNYDGFGRNARDNDTVFIYAWSAF